MDPNGHRTTRRNRIVQGKSVTNSSNDVDELDPWTAWAYKPRTISLLLIGACLLMYMNLVLGVAARYCGVGCLAAAICVWVQRSKDLSANSGSLMGSKCMTGLL